MGSINDKKNWECLFWREREEGRERVGEIGMRGKEGDGEGLRERKNVCFVCECLIVCERVGGRQSWCIIFEHFELLMLREEGKRGEERKLSSL